MNRPWKETVRMNGTQELKTDDRNHEIIQARFRKCVREGNYDEIANLQAASTAFTTTDGVLKESVMFYTFQGKGGIEVDVPSGDHEAFLSNKDYTLIKSGVKEVTI